MRRACLAALAAASAYLGTGLAQTAGESPALTCSGYAQLARKAYRPARWWKDADPTPATKGERDRLRVFAGYCGDGIRNREQDGYWDFYRRVIAPDVCAGRRWANCTVAICESGLGSGGGNLYGMVNAWYEPWLPLKRGNRTGTRFAGSAWGATKLEQDVFAAAAFRHGANTCAT